MSKITEEHARTKSIELYSLATPNGIKVAAYLEELSELNGGAVSYVPYPIDIRRAENRTEAFDVINPNHKIPAIIDPCGVNGEPVTVFESGAILLYLATKFNEFIPSDKIKKAEVLSWLFWGSTGFSNNVKQFGFFRKFCGQSIPYCVERCTREVNRLLDALNRQLSDGRPYVTGGKLHSRIYSLPFTSLTLKMNCLSDMYTIADISIWPWVYALHETYDDAAEVRQVTHIECTWLMLVPIGVLL